MKIVKQYYNEKRTFNNRILYFLDIKIWKYIIEFEKQFTNVYTAEFFIGSPILFISEHQYLYHAIQSIETHLNQSLNSVDPLIGIEKLFNAAYVELSKVCDSNNSIFQIPDCLISSIGDFNFTYFNLIAEKSQQDQNPWISIVEYTTESIFLITQNIEKWKFDIICYYYSYIKKASNFEPTTFENIIGYISHSNNINSIIDLYSNHNQYYLFYDNDQNPNFVIEDDTNQPLAFISCKINI